METLLRIFGVGWRAGEAEKLPVSVIMVGLHRSR